MPAAQLARAQAVAAGGAAAAPGQCDARPDWQEEQESTSVRETAQMRGPRCSLELPWGPTSLSPQADGVLSSQTEKTLH